MTVVNKQVDRADLVVDHNQKHNQSSGYGLQLELQSPTVHLPQLFEAFEREVDRGHRG